MSEFITASRGEMERVMDAVKMVAATEMRVLLTGETGVGKELIARCIHDHSLQRDTTMVTMNCAGVAEGLLESELFGHEKGSFTGALRDRKGAFEQAAGSTLFLDEVGDTSPRFQSVLLRVLETGEIQKVGSDSHRKSHIRPRIISATNKNLKQMVAEGDFRCDLFQRLCVFPIHIPPLRERPEDLKLLIDHFVAALAKRHRVEKLNLANEARAALNKYSWPGNVRELQNVLERLTITYIRRIVMLDNLPEEIQTNTAFPITNDLVPEARAEDLSTQLYRKMVVEKEGDFWDVVGRPFLARDLNRGQVLAVIRLAMIDSRGNYKVVAQSFNLPPADYKRFLNFLRKHQCQLRFTDFRRSTNVVPISRAS